ncbi:acetyl-coenzyme A synthetase N-terminal domain-containing protein, partial [Photobacterium sanctipauli]
MSGHTGGSTMSVYQKEYQLAQTAPQDFWQQQAQKLPWYQFPQTILSKDEN